MARTPPQGFNERRGGAGGGGSVEEGLTLVPWSDIIIQQVCSTARRSKKGQSIAIKDGRRIQENLGWGAGAVGGGGKAAIATAPPPTKIWVTHTETGKNWRGKQNHMAFWT